MNVGKYFLDGKKIALGKLAKAKKEHLVDEKILPILDIINSSDNYYTSSSCAGRIVLLEIPSIGDKKNAIFLGKWHQKIQNSQILSAVKNAKQGHLWLLAQSPIIHICCKTGVDADNLLKIAISSGFKNSGVKSLEGRFVVEVASTERLDCPVGRDGILFCNNDYISLLVEISNDVISRSLKKLSRLENKIKENVYIA